MESSSDDSFAWTDASEDSIDSDTMAVNNIVKEQSGNESEYGKSYKKKLQKELFAYKEDNNENNVHQKGKKRKMNNEIYKDDNNESPKKKKIKLEPESDIELSKKKNKSKYGESDRLEIRSKDSLSNDESYLDLRVKEEEIALRVPSPIVTKKKEKRKKMDLEANGDNELSDLGSSLQTRTNDTTCNDISDIVQVMDYEDNEIKKKKRKKKKIKKRKDFSEEESEVSFINIKDKFSAEETVIEPHYLSNNEEYRNSFEQLIEKQNTLQNRDGNWNSDSEKHVDRHKARMHNEIETLTLESESMSHEDSLPARSDQQQSCEAESVRTKTNKNHNIPEKTNPRISRLSDRIRFEDEDSLQIDNSDSNTMIGSRSRKLDNFLKINENLTPISSKLKNDSILTTDDEIWIVRCPHDVTANAFQDITIPLDKKHKIKVDGSTYEGSMEDHINTITVLSQEDNKFVLKNLSSKGILHFRKRVPKVHIRDDVLMLNNQTDFIPLPETKVRHPLFGSNYKKAIKISGSVKERLQANISVTRDERKKGTKLKKNKKKSKDVDLDLNIETKSQASEESVSKKKRKNRKHSASEGQLIQKHQNYNNTHSAELWDSEKAIEEKLFHF